MPHPLLIFSQSEYLIQLAKLLQICILQKTNSVDPDQLASEQIWIYTVCKGKAYLGSAGPGLSHSGNVSLFVLSYFSIKAYTTGTHLGECF